MACNTLRSDSIGELAGGRLAAPAVEELLAHLEGCEPCSRELDAVAALVAASEDGIAAAAPVALGSSGAWRRWAALAAGILVLFFVRTAWFAGGDPLSIEELAVLAPLPAPPATLRGGSEDEAPLWSAAMESYRAGDYARAAGELEAAIAAGDGRALAQLYLGLAQLQTGALDAAETALVNVERLDDGLLRERARWYRANLYLRRGDAPRARELLDDIVWDAGEYELNARAVLERLDALGAD